MTATVLTTTALDIVNGSLRLIGEIDANQPTPANQMQDGLEALNFMVKSFQSQGLHLWTKVEGILFLDVGKESYKLGPSGDEAGNLDDFVNTTLTVAGVATDQTLTVASTTGMAGADDILSADPSESLAGWTIVGGVLLLSGTSLQLNNSGNNPGNVTRTIDGLTFGRSYTVTIGFTLGTSVSATYSMEEGTTTLGSVTLTATGTGRFQFTATQTSHTFRILNGDSTGILNTITDSIEVFDHTTGDFIGIRLDDGTRQWTNIVEVLSSTQVLNADGLTGTAAIGLSVFSFPELIPRPLRLLQLRRKTIGNDDEIEATQWSRQEYFAQPNKASQGAVNQWYYTPELTNGRVYVWQPATDVDKVAQFTYIRPIDVNTDTADNPDFPAEWFDLLRYNLAVRIASEYRIPQDRIATLKVLADEMLDDALGYDREDSSLDIQPDFRSA